MGTTGSSLTQAAALPAADHRVDEPRFRAEYALFGSLFQELLHNLNPACHRGYVKPNAAIRIGDWKLLVDCFNYTLMAPTGQVSLYNITCE